VLFNTEQSIICKVSVPNIILPPTLLVKLLYWLSIVLTAFFTVVTTSTVVTATTATTSGLSITAGGVEGLFVFEFV